MKRIYLAEGRDPAEFAQAYNKALEDLTTIGYEVVSEKFISDTSAYIFYDADEDSDDVIEAIRERAEAAYEERKPEYIVEAAEKETGTKSILIELRVDVPRGRRCCECGNYKWGIGCPYRDGTIRFMDDACGMFDVLISRG